MTWDELDAAFKSLGYWTKLLQIAMREARNTLPSLDARCRKGRNQYTVIDYTLDEVMAVAACAKMTFAEREMLREKYISHGGKYIYPNGNREWVSGTDDFVERYKKRKRVLRCCATCEYIRAKDSAFVSGNVVRPYCAFYDFYVCGQRWNVYKHVCSAWSNGEKAGKKVLKWRWRLQPVPIDGEK